MEYITTKEAAERWGCSESTVRKWCQNGLLFSIRKAEKVSGRWRIPVDAKCPKKNDKGCKQ